MAASPALSIIICTYNRAAYLRDTLQSLLDRGAGPASFEVLIVDNNSTDETPAVVASFIESHGDLSIRYLQENQQGLSFARNRGIRESHGPVLLFVDDDVRIPPGYIRAWLSFFEQYPQASGGGGKIHVQFDDPRPGWMSHFLLPLLGYHDLGDSIRKYPSNKYPFGGNMAFRREVFDRYGMFNTSLGRKGAQLTASEEKEFYRRIRGDEAIYYIPGALLYHRVSRERLTESYIRKQAVGLGKSIALQMEKASSPHRARQLGSELFKSLATVVLCVGYSLALQFEKAEMLVKFRRWIWEGYRNTSTP